MRFIRKGLAALAVLMVGSVTAQDINYSQYYTVMPAINPASTGAFGGDYRFIMDYRQSQYSAADPFTTIFASWDMGIAKYKKSDGSERKSFFGAGLNFLNDKAGEGDLGLQEINLMLSYNLRIGELHHLTLGTKVGQATRSVNYSNFRWESQFDEGSASYDPNAFSDPLANNEKANYTPISVGLLWNYAKEDHLKLNAGFALNQVNEPESNFDNRLVENVPMQMVFHTAAEWFIPNTTMSLMPHVMYRSRSYVSETTVGVISKFYLSFDSRMTHIKKSSAFYAGIFYRTTKDLVLLMKVDLRQNIDLGISYDMDISGEAGTSFVKKRGALEFVLTYSSFWKERTLLPRKGNTEFF
ncbi:MAG: PorP/SprF family type IX secretion system membrane protein [Vicingaceae bacterium]